MSEVQEIFREVFDDESLTLSKDTNADDLEDWDSLANIRLLFAVQKHFGIKFTLNEATAMKNVGDMIDLILAKKAG